jgi:hypothetical protein
MIMLRLSLLILFLISSVPLTGCYSQNFTVSAPKQEAGDPYSWDFGSIPEGVVVKHAFVLKNESSRPLAIKDLTSSCGCTASKIGKRILLPGESDSIEVEFKSKGYSGPVQQFVYVNTDRLEDPIIKFSIKANVVKK